MALAVASLGLYGYERHGTDTGNVDGWFTQTNAHLASSITWPTANMAIYVPTKLRLIKPVLKLWFASGTIGTGNIDMGVYDAIGVRLVSSGSTAKVASQSEQVLDIADTVMGPGLFYLAVVCSNNTDTFEGPAPAAPALAAYGILTEASAFPLPATATWVMNQTLAFAPRGGMLFGTMIS